MIFFYYHDEKFLYYEDKLNLHKVVLIVFCKFIINFLKIEKYIDILILRPNLNNNWSEIGSFCFSKKDSKLPLEQYFWKKKILKKF